MTRATLFAAVLGLALVSAARGSCYNSCRFKFCSNTDTLTIGQPDVALGPAICDKYGQVCVGHVDSTGEAYVVDYDPKRISQWSPSGLKQNFSPSFFKSYGLPDGRSSVGHEVPQQNQGNFLHNRCFILPLTAYQVLNKPGGVVIDNIHPQPSTSLTDCIAFTAL
jgi:hypothetical protein